MGLIAQLRPQAAGQVSFDATNAEMVRRVFGDISSSGKSVNERAVLGVSAAWCCRRILSESIGMLPWGIFRKEDNGNAQKADDYWLHDVLVHSPNRDQTTVEFRETKTLNLTGDGNAYSLIDRTGKRVSSLTPICDVEPMRSDGSNTREVPKGEIFFRTMDRGKQIDFPREKIWQVKGFGRDLLKGLSPIGAAREALGGALAMEEFANRFFANGAIPAGTVTYPGWLDPKQKEQATEALQKMVGGLGKAHQMALLQGGMKAEPWKTMNLEEMQFIVARRFSVLEICRFYRVPPHMVAELEKGASYASIEQMSQEFVMFTLMPYLTRFEASVSKWLIPEQDRRKYFLRFNYEGLLRADSKGRAEMYASALQNGWATRNEVRAKENWNKSTDQGMDSFTVQLNLTPIEKLGESEEKPEQPKQMESVTPRIEINMPERAQESALTMQLPESISKQMKYSVDHPAIREIAESAKASEERIEQRMNAADSRVDALSAAVAELAKATEQANAATRRATENLAATVENLARESAKQGGPRKVVLDKYGEPIGTVPCESWELH